MSDPSANPGYAFDRLSRALHTAAHDPDPAARARAAARAERWRAVVEGMQAGDLRIGSRTPTDFPAWVTLEVVHGGFVTGKAAAAGPLLDHERALLRRLGAPETDDAARARLNRYFLSDAGQVELLAAMKEHRLHITVAEEGALVVVAWLLARGEADALAVVEALEPWFATLRFYPQITATPQHRGVLARRMSVGEVATRLRARRLPKPVAAMNDALAVWAPLYDRLVALWGETVEGEAPTLVDGAVVGGWPCRRWPDDWRRRRSAWMAAYRAAAAVHTLGGQHAHPRSNFTRLHKALVQCPRDSSALSGRDVGWIRRALANTHSRRGAPGSAQRTALRAEQAQQAALPTRPELAGILVARLSRWPADGGLPTLDGFDHDVKAGEHPRVPGGTPIPDALSTSVRLAYEAPLAELVERGIVGSAELLATFVPQIIARHRSAGFDDPAVRALYEAIYTAFRRRRSVLLLDMSHQVRAEELPWFAALQARRREDAATQRLAAGALRELTLLYLTRFPHAITPNPLVSELHGLVERAGLKLPLCEELAADIFMGRFTPKWPAAADRAARLLDGTVYARYYDLPPGPEPAMPKDFAQWCTARAREAGARGSSWVAQNGTVIEQSQIVTTHNLAVLVDGLGLMAELRPLAGALAEQVLGRVVDRARSLPTDRRGQLLAIKSMAYAWRQAVFLLACASPDDTERAIHGLRARIAADPNAERLLPAWRGLRLVSTGGRFDVNGVGQGDPEARRLLGWCLGRHWLMPESA